MDQVLGQDEWVECVALIYRVLEVRLQFVKGNDMEDGKEDEEGVQDQGNNVRKGCECETHLARL